MNKFRIPLAICAVVAIVAHSVKKVNSVIEDRKKMMDSLNKKK